MFLLLICRTCMSMFLASSFPILSLHWTYFSSSFLHISLGPGRHLFVFTIPGWWASVTFFCSLNTVLNIKFPELFSNLTVNFSRMEPSRLIFCPTSAMSSVAQFTLFSYCRCGFISHNLYNFWDCFRAQEDVNIDSPLWGSDCTFALIFIFILLGYNAHLLEINYYTKPYPGRCTIYKLKFVSQVRNIYKAHSSYFSWQISSWEWRWT